MFQLSLRTLALVSLSVLVGCGVRTDGTEDTPQPGAATLAPASSSSAFAETMRGGWLSQCVTAEDGTSSVLVDVFSAGELTSSVKLSEGTSCAYELFEIRLSADYNLGSTSFISSGVEVTDIDTRVNRVWLRPTDLDFANFLNEQSMCGNANWSTDEFEIVTNCRDLLTGDFEFYSIVELDQQDLYYGDTSGSKVGTSQATRPTDIDYSIKFSRVFSDDPISSQTDSNIAASRGTSTETLEFYLEKVRSIEFGANRN